MFIRSEYTLKYVEDKDKEEFVAALKEIYHTHSEHLGYERMQEVTKRWQEHYPNTMKSWPANRDAISPILKYSASVRKIIYTINVIESLNSTYKRLNRSRSVFPSDTVLLKALYLATFVEPKDGQCPYITGGRFMVNCPLCMKGVSRNSKK